MRQRVRRIPADGILQIGQPQLHPFPGPPVDAVLSLEVELVGLHVRGRLLPDLPTLLVGQLGLERGRDLQRHVALDGEDVGQLAIVGLGPEVPVRLDVDQLGDDPHPVPGPPDAALEQRGHVQDLTDLPQAPVALLEPHHRAAPDHPQRPDLGELGDHVLGDPVGEELVLRIGAEIAEGQDGDRGGRRPRRGRSAQRLGKGRGRREPVGRRAGQGALDRRLHRGGHRRPDPRGSPGPGW